MTDQMRPEGSPPAHKRRLSRPRRALRALIAAFDPRAWAHGVKLLNYYNYSHVVPRRLLTLGPNASISPNAVFSNPERIALPAAV